jgi:hypothetical protein
MTTPDEVRFGKEIIRFGTWIVTEQGLLAEKPHYFIDKTRLWDVGAEDANDKFACLLHVPERPWITEADLYALNTAFFFALDYFKDIQPSDRTAVSVWKTLKFQHSEFERRRRNRDQEELRQSD